MHVEDLVQRPQAFDAWRHPDVPHDAEILYATGSEVLPTQAGDSILLGHPAFAPGPYLLAYEDVAGDRPDVRIRLLAFGCGIVDAGVLVGNALGMGAGGVSQVLTILGLGQPTYVRDFTMTSAAGSHALCDDAAGANTGALCDVNRVIRLEGFGIRQATTVNCIGAGAVHISAVLPGHLEARDCAFQVGTAGYEAGAVLLPRYRPLPWIPFEPEILRHEGDRPRLHPVTGPTPIMVEPGRAFVVRCTTTAATLQTPARAVAFAAFARWTSPGR